MMKIVLKRQGSEKRKKIMNGKLFHRSEAGQIRKEYWSKFHVESLLEKLFVCKESRNKNPLN